MQTKSKFTMGSGEIHEQAICNIPTIGVLIRRCKSLDKTNNNFEKEVTGVKESRHDDVRCKKTFDFVSWFHPTAIVYPIIARAKETTVKSEKV